MSTEDVTACNSFDQDQSKDKLEKASDTSPASDSSSPLADHHQRAGAPGQPLRKGVSHAFSIEDPIFVDWDGSDDPNNPRNFSRARKWAVSSVGIAFCGLVSLSVAGYAICLESVQEELGTSREVAILGITLFTLMFGTAPLLLSPLSELYGRNLIYYVSAAIFTLFFIPQALAKNVPTMLVSRFISGTAGSTAVSLVGGTLTDVWNDADRSWPMALFAWAAFATVGMGPAMFGYVEQFYSFRLMSWILFAVSGLFTLLLFVLLKETRASVLLTRKAARLRAETGDMRYRSLHEERRGTLFQMLRHNLSRPIRLLFTEPVLAAFTLWISFAWLALYLLLESIAGVFADVYGFSIGQAGLVFISEIIGATLGLIIDHFCNKLYLKMVDKRGPEARLYTAMAGGICFPVGAWIYAWTTFPDVHWIAPCIGLTVLYTGIQTVYLSCFNFLADAYDLYASSALSAQSFVRNLVGAVCPLFAGQMIKSLGIQGTGSLVAGLGTVLSATPFVLFVYGSRLRGRSKFAQEMQRMKEREIRRNEQIMRSKGAAV